MCVLSIHSYVVVSEMETFFKYWQTTVFLIFMLKSTVKPEKKNWLYYQYIPKYYTKRKYYFIIESHFHTEYKCVIFSYFPNKHIILHNVIEISVPVSYDSYLIYTY